MLVYRSIGVAYDPGEDDARRPAVQIAGGVFVAPSEEQAIAWALVLWHRAPKHAVQVIEVSRIRDPHTLTEIKGFLPHGYLVEFVPAGDGGFHVVHHDVELFEAVVLPQDIVKVVSSG